jgi:glucuronate isomerase
MSGVPTTEAPWVDRLLPADPTTRDVARHLYEQVAGAPIISPHGHVPARLLAEDQPFSDPATLFVSSDHYVTRQLHASGAGLDALSVAHGADPRDVWRTLAGHSRALAGTASAVWLRDELASVFGIEHDLTPGNADEMFDRISELLRQPEFRPRALFNRFGIQVLATTDDPLDSLDAHQALSESTTLAGRVVPTLRADAYIDPAATNFRVNAERLLAAVGAPATFAGYLGALQERRAYFIERGAVSVDVGVTDPATAELTAAEAERLFQRALTQALSPEDQRLLCAHMLLQLAAMSVEDGLVLTIHAGVYRNHSAPTWERFGPDTGHDIPVPISFTRGLKPLLDRFGLEPNLHLILFTVDETTFSRELAPLAGFYPTVYIGAPWWFLDAPDAILRWRSAITETAGFYRSSGFIDDTRAFLSIPARHDVSRRTDASFLARYVVEERVTAAMAERVIADLVDGIPRMAFKL